VVFCPPKKGKSDSGVKNKRFPKRGGKKKELAPSRGKGGRSSPGALGPTQRKSGGLLGGREGPGPPGPLRKAAKNASFQPEKTPRREPPRPSPQTTTRSVPAPKFQDHSLPSRGKKKVMKPGPLSVEKKGKGFAPSVRKAAMQNLSKGGKRKRKRSPAGNHPTKKAKKAEKIRFSQGHFGSPVPSATWKGDGAG